MPSHGSSARHAPPWTCLTTPWSPVEGPGAAPAAIAGTRRSTAALRSVRRTSTAYPASRETSPGSTSGGRLPAAPAPALRRSVPCPRLLACGGRDLDVDRAVLLRVPVDLHLGAGLRDVDADPACLVLAQGIAGIARRPPALRVVEERHAGLRPERRRDTLLVERDRVGLLDTERRVVGLDPCADDAAVGPVEQPGVSVDGKDLALAGMVTDVVVRVLGVPVPDQHAVLVRMPLGP